MENLLRTYTEQELNELFAATGFPEVAKQYCVEKYNEKFAEHRKYDIDEEEYQKGKDAWLEYLKEACGWKVDNLRKHAWEVALGDMNIEAYIHQRELGHGHEWSKLFCDNLFDIEDTRETNTYWETYQQLRDSRKDVECVCDKKGIILKRKEGTLSDREFKLAVKNMAKGEGEIVERFIGYMIGSRNKGKVEELFQEALGFKNFYYRIVADGHLPEEAWHYALDLWDEDADSVYSMVYKEAMKHKETHAKAWTFAKFCSKKTLIDIGHS